MLPEKASMKQKFPETGTNYCGQEKHHWNLARKVAGKGQQLQWTERLLTCSFHGDGWKIPPNPSAWAAWRKHTKPQETKNVAHGTSKSLWFAARCLYWLALIQNSPGTHEHIDWAATKNALPITKNQLLPHKTGAQAMWCLFLKGNVRGEKILSRHTRKSCIRTGLIMWKGKSLSWQCYRALNQANYHRDKAAWLLQGEVMSLMGSIRIPEVCQISSEEHR